MVKFYRINSHMKHKSCGFSWIAILLCILSIHVLLSSARPGLDETSVEKITESNADVIKAMSELPPETQKSIEDFIKGEQNRPTEEGAENQDPDVIDENSAEDGEVPEGNDYYDQFTGPVDSYTELKTTPLPLTRVYLRVRNDDDDSSEEYDIPSENIETMPPPRTSTSTTEESTPRIKELQNEGDNHGILESIEGTSTIKITTPLPNKGLTMKTYSSILFVSVLLYILA